MTCKCGTASLRFDNLTAADFPEGWEAECCSENTTPTLKETMEQLPTTSELPDLDDESIAEIAEQVMESYEKVSKSVDELKDIIAEAEPKKRGRKPGKK